ncbi:MAG TPA: hypothetical protein VFK57_04520 [Vicinamibacterales bacterium]|nr:hypothetical protein [Vicinamibacterales bacterium]
MRRSKTCLAILALVLCPAAAGAQSPESKTTDLDAFMARALQRRDIDRKTLEDYVLDEVEEFEVLGPGRAPFTRMRRKYTWYVRDGYHVRSPLEFDGVPIPEADRRAYEDRWLKAEQRRRASRSEREAKRAAEGKPPVLGAPSINEPRFVSESYFMDFKFEPGNYYLAGKDTVDGTAVLKIDYLPTRLFSDNDEERRAAREERDDSRREERREERRDARSEQQRRREKEIEADIDRKMNKSSQVALWVDPTSHQIVKYTFDNVWLDFLPAGWIVRIDDLRASMQMGQPFPGVWLPRGVSIHAGVTIALGSIEVQYTRAFSNYRRADVSSKVSVPKRPGLKEGGR